MQTEHRKNFQLRRVPHNYANIVAQYKACCSCIRLFVESKGSFKTVSNIGVKGSNVGVGVNLTTYDFTGRLNNK